MCLIWTEKNRIQSKKKLTYREQCPLKREAYLDALQRAQQHGKVPVYGDESGFATESILGYAYAPKGVPVADQISVHQYRSTSLIAARINGSFTVTSLLFEGQRMQRRSMRG